jgi:hypothetical protein
MLWRNSLLQCGSRAGGSATKWYYAMSIGEATLEQGISTRREGKSRNVGKYITSSWRREFDLLIRVPRYEMYRKILGVA